MKWFSITSAEDLRVPASPGAREFFNYTVKSHFETMAPIIRAMANSQFGEVAQEGAAQITARWLFDGYFEAELKICQNGTIFQRQGVASVASHLLSDSKYKEICIDLLKPILNDSDKEVRQKFPAIKPIISI